VEQLLPLYQQSMMNKSNLPPLWYEQLKNILTLSQGVNPPMRKQCGLIDGGWLLNKIFGVAMQKQVNHVRNLVSKAYEQDQVVTHYTQKLATVINQDQVDIQANRHKINDLIKYNEHFLAYLRS
jgi:hypothetical protein